MAGSSVKARVRSLAKINLDLRVLNKRQDGFHELRTIFQTISLADTIDIEYRRGRTRIDINSNLNIPGNLIVQAADSVLRSARVTGQLCFVLKKRIPWAAVWEAGRATLLRCCSHCQCCWVNGCL